MFCAKCGSENVDNATFCIKCGADLTKQTPPEKKYSKDTLDDLDTTIQPEIDADSFKPGSLFANRYEILDEGKKGGMGAVYKCKDTKLNHVIALKIIHPRLLSSKQAVSRFRQEVAISMKLQHPNIVRVYNLEEWEGKEYFTMEWVEGITLREVIKERKKGNKPFSIEESNKIMSQLSDALQYAHQHTIHRDIKPENILVTGYRIHDAGCRIDESIKIKLTDFGIAKMLSPSQFTSTSIQMGTPYYMAPEQKTDAGNVDKRADIYALGVVLFELLTLENTVGLEMPSEINKEVHRGIDNVIKKALATKPEQRYADAKGLSDALQKCLLEERKRDEDATRKAEEQRKKEEEKKKRAEEERRREEERKRREEDERRREEEKRKRREDEQKSSSTKKVIAGAVLILIVVIGIIIYSGQQRGPEMPLEEETAVTPETYKEPSTPSTTQAPVPVPTVSPPVHTPQTTPTEPLTSSTTQETKETKETKETTKIRRYTVQVVVFKDASDADALKAKLDKKGYKTYIIPTGTKRHEKLYKVLVGEFTTRKEAEVLSINMKKSEGLQTFVTFMPSKEIIY